jgi:exodeoxyribonuclease V alpha subunit
MTFLASHDITPGIAQKIYRAYGTASIDKIRANPYRMADEIFGISFKISDAVAQRLGVALDDPHRLRAGLLHALKQAEDDGHMYLPREVLMERAEGLLEASREKLEEPLESALAAGRVVIEEDRVYLTWQHRLEERIADAVASRVARPGRGEPSEAQIAEIERDLGGIRLAALQRECLRRSLASGIFIMTGGPGTGKTTTVRSLLRWCAMLDLSVELAAPTGRASRRLSEASGADARTLHRLLEYSPQEHAFLRNADRPLDTDAVIVDEASMIDAWLFAALMEALPDDAFLVLVGDVDQLPSVGAGCVLRDLIASGCVPVVFLNEIFRQGEGSLIIGNSHRINRGEMPEKGAADDDFFFLAEEDPARVAETVISLCATRLPAYYGFDPITDVQVIAPMYRGDAGVINLNNALQEKLNPPPEGAVEVSVSNGRVRLGDKVMQIRNNYDKGVFNGDMGVVTSVDGEEKKLRVALLGPSSDPVEYAFDDANELVLAYACSVHKSQGSEFAAAVIPLTMQHYMMLQRNLIYTAVTRARKLVVLVGSRKALGVAVRNDRVEKRYTRLAEKVRTRRVGEPRGADF